METNNKLREALINIAASVRDESEDTELPCVAYGIARRVRRMAEAALAEPVRNCEVGTPMEQGERFSAYCRAHKHPESECLTCPLLGQTGGHCELAWAQMPYEEGGAE